MEKYVEKHKKHDIMIIEKVYFFGFLIEKRE